MLAVSLDVVPQSLADRAADIAEREEQLRGYNAIMQAQRDRIEDDVWQVVEHWTGKDTTTNERYAAIRRFVERLGVHEVLDAVDITLGARIRSQRRAFLFFCKVCWNKVSAIEDAE